ncbi:MAG TPA: uracil-DNA glycosylase [candidate division Zixibacteria bacterium]|nr:uracil-DNA glycosylase [candidate division Zixibacteria bacterium]
MARPGVRGEAARYLAQQRELGEDELNLKLKPPRPAAKKLPGLDEYRRQISSCRKCPLWKTRTSFVFGDGAPDARLVFVGEAPGQDEDLQGKPFVGAAGQLLTKIIEAIKLKRSEVFICNILKCRPPGNRNPLPEEIRQCEPHLRAQLEIIKPKVICALGTFAAQTLLQNNTPISKLRGRIHHYQNIKLVPTYHPAALLRNPGWKRPTWEDVQLVRKIYDGEA